ncbi:hypothetical protein Tco_0977683 [Tanacetum coccineum]|uniref:Uncharacterized protein n=1 Tax=Tanacetum coccineum TaxID=301880 RepID=A0ABQ5EKT3_9ASTR
MGVSHDLRGDSWGYFRRRPTAKGVGLRVADSHTGNHPEDGFTPLETIRRLLVVIGRRSHSGFKGEAFEPERRHCVLSAKELNEFLSLYPIPSKYDVILPTSTQTIFDAPSGYVGLYTHSFSLANLRLPLTDFFCESRPHVKRKLASGSSSSCAVSAKTSASKDDAPILSISNDDKGLPDCFELKDANACHLKIFAITLPAWKGYLDNQMDLELLDLHDRCYEQKVVVDHAVNRLEKDLIRRNMKSFESNAMAEFDQNPAVLVLREKISSLTADVKEHKARLEAVEASLHREVEELKQDKRDVVSKVVPYAVMELVAAMKEPFDLSKAKGYRSSYKKEHTQASNDFATAMFRIGHQEVP